MLGLAAAPLSMTEAERAALEVLARLSSLPHRKVVQAKALCLLVMAWRRTKSPAVVARLKTRCGRGGAKEGVCQGVRRIAPGRGRRSLLPRGTVAGVVSDTPLLMTAPRWTTRLMARRHGLGKDAVARIWRDHSLKPWRVDTFKLSTDLEFEVKLVDVVCRYLNPPERAAALCFDERLRARLSTAPSPSCRSRPGRAGTLSHDYKRHGTTDLLAAINVAAGEVLYDCKKRHAAVDVHRFLELTDLHVPAELEIHVALDTLSAYKAPPVAQWLAHSKRARWHLHFTPTTSSWLNLVERWFAELTERRVRRCVFTSLIEAIETWPFVWHTPARAIITKVLRGRATLTRIQSARGH